MFYNYAQNLRDESLFLENGGQTKCGIILLFRILTFKFTFEK